MRLMCVLLVGAFLVSCVHTQNGERATWDEERWGEIQPQELDSSCGLASLLTIMRYHFGDTRFDERMLLAEYIRGASERALQRAMRDGLSLLEIETLAQSVGYRTMRKMFTLYEVERVVTVTPVLVYLEIGQLRHFAVVRGISGDVVWLADSARGNIYYSRRQFLAEWRTPEALRGVWSRPGGLVLLRPEGKFNLELLREPTAQYPRSFFELQRRMMRRQ